MPLRSLIFAGLLPNPQEHACGSDVEGVMVHTSARLAAASALRNLASSIWDWVQRDRSQKMLYIVGF